MLIFSRGFLLLAFIFFVSFSASAQYALYQGIVTDINHKPLFGVAVSAGEGLGSSTDANGMFSTKIIYPSKVKFNYLGYKPIEKYLDKEIVGMDTIVMIEEAQNLNEVVVTANKRGQNINEVSQTMEVIHQDFLIESQTVEVQKALEKIPGIVVQKDEVSIRGASGFSYGAGSRVMVMVDDMPMLSADASDPKWNYYPVENINKIEVLKGAASALYGSAAMEGIINLRTAVAADTPYTMIKAYGGFYDHPLKKDTGFWAKQKKPRFVDGITIAHRQTFGPFKITASATINNDDGYRLDDKSYVERLNLFVQYIPKHDPRFVIDFSLNGMHDTGRIFLFSTSVNNAYVPLPGTSTIYNYYRWHTDLSIKFYASETTKHILRTRYFTTINMDNSEHNSIGQVWYNEYQLQKILRKKRHTETDLTAGAVYTLSKTLSDSIYHNHNGQNVAAYAQLDHTVGKLLFNVGGRIEANRVDTFKWDYAPVFRAGLNYHLAKYTYLRASFGQGFRYPSVAEMFTTTSAGLLNILPNPELKPETGWSSEVAARQLFEVWGIKGYVDASAFLSKYNNMIEFVFGNHTPAGLPPQFKYFGFEAINVENTLIEGFEISTGMEKEFGKLHVDLSGGYTFVLPYNEDSVGKKLAEPYHEYLSFRHKDMVKGNLNLEYKKIGFGFYSYYNSPFLNLDQFFLSLVQGLATNNYWQPYSAGFVADVRLSYKIVKNVNLSFFVKNVFNAEFMEVPGNTNAPRSYQLQAVWEF